MKVSPLLRLALCAGLLSCKTTAPQSQVSSIRSESDRILLSTMNINVAGEDPTLLSLDVNSGKVTKNAKFYVTTFKIHLYKVGDFPQGQEEECESTIVQAEARGTQGVTPLIQTDAGDGLYMFAKQLEGTAPLEVQKNPPHLRPSRRYAS